MAEACRSCWRNCAAQADDEIRAIDAMEDALAAVDDAARRIRDLITCVESCHHRVLRRVELIIEAIGAGRSDKGPGRRPPGQVQPREVAWRNAVDILEAWSLGQAQEVIGREVEGIPATELLAALAERTPLRAWLAQKLAEHIRQYLDPRTMWREHAVIEVDGAADAMEFRRAAARAMIQDTVSKQASRDSSTAGAGKDDEGVPWYENPASISLAAAIDNFRSCNWNFSRNLLIVCKAIGGNLHPGEPYAACARNVDLAPARPRMRQIAAAMKAYSAGDAKLDGIADCEILRALGESTPVKRWLAASLGKTIRMQLDL